MRRQKDIELVKRRRLMLRQTLIFGALIGALVVVGVGAAAMFQGKIDPIFDAPFSSPEPPSFDFGPTPCPSAQDAKFPKAGAVKVNVLNGSDLSGAAASASRTLESRGFVLGTVADATIEFGGTVLIRTGAAGVDKAYMVAQYAPADAVIAFDLRDDDSVDLIVGSQYDGLRTLSEITVKAGTAITAVSGCQPADQILVSATTAGPTAPVPSSSSSGVE
jgi:hypothetical protein